MHFNVCQLSLLTFEMMLMTLMFALIYFCIFVYFVYFSLLYAQWHIWMQKSVIECWLKCKNRNWIWFMRKCSYFRANECILALLVAFWRKWLRISRNEQQKTYCYSHSQVSSSLAAHLAVRLSLPVAPHHDFWPSRVQYNTIQ